MRGALVEPLSWVRGTCLALFNRSQRSVTRDFS